MTLNFLNYQTTFLPLKSKNFKFSDLSGKISGKQTTPQNHGNAQSPLEMKLYLLFSEEHPNFVLGIRVSEESSIGKKLELKGSNI